MQRCSLALVCTLALVLAAGCDPSSKADAGAGPDSAPHGDLGDASPDRALTDLPAPDRQRPDAPRPDLPLPDKAAPDTFTGDAGSPLHSWVTIPAGTFTMGSPTSEPCREPAYKETQHKVTLTKSFYMMTTEVTNQQFEKNMKGSGVVYTINPGCKGCPYMSLDWNSAAFYCNVLSKAKGLASCYTCTGTDAYGDPLTCSTAVAYAGGKIYICPGYRLPTEAEWEYAYRAKTTTAYYNGANDPKLCTDCTTKDKNADKIAWYCANTSGSPLAGIKQPNAWGLYDMAGSAMEWCHDLLVKDLGAAAVTDPWGAATGTRRVLRGGSTAFNYWGRPETLRAAHRDSAPNTLNNVSFGFRCVRTK